MNRSPENPARRTKWTRLLVVAALMALATAGLWLTRSPAPRPPVEMPPAPAPVVVARTNLVLCEGHLCLAGRTNAFTGQMIEYASDGSLRSRSSVSNGLLHGLSEGWHTNGQLQVAEHFRAGVSHGLRTKWHPNGVKLSEAEIVEGKFQGPFRRWSDTGALAEQVEFVDGQPQGVSLAWYPSGFLKAHITMQQGRVVEKNYWPDGETKDPLLASSVPMAAQNAVQRRR